MAQLLIPNISGLNTVINGDLGQVRQYWDDSQFEAFDDHMAVWEQLEATGQAQMPHGFTATLTK